jgi:hypothetical protein
MKETSMRRVALLGLSCLLAGCQFAGNPFSGFGGFVQDTHTFRSNPNLPAGSDETMRRVQGQEAGVQPLLPEPGDIWPGPMKPIPTMQELQQQNFEQLPPPQVPAAPPPPLFPEQPPATPRTQTLTTPRGPVTVYTNPNGVRTFNAPGGGQGIVVTNPNGTTSLIDPNGSVMTVPTPK